MADGADQTRSLKFRFNSSISGKCSFLDAQVKDMERSAIYAYRGLNLISACISVILKPHFRYSLRTCLIPSSMFFAFILLIMIPVANIMCWYMVLRNPVTLMCMRSHNRVIFFYLSIITLGAFVTIIGSTCFTLWRTVLHCKCVTLGPSMSSAIPSSSRRIGIFCSIFLSTACRILFTSWSVMCCNHLVQSAICTSRVVYYLLFFSTCGVGGGGGGGESFAIMCAFFLFLRRYLILW